MVFKRNDKLNRTQQATEALPRHLIIMLGERLSTITCFIYSLNLAGSWRAGVDDTSHAKLRRGSKAMESTINNQFNNSLPCHRLVALIEIMNPLMLPRIHQCLINAILW